MERCILRFSYGSILWILSDPNHTSNRVDHGPFSKEQAFGAQPRMVYGSVGDSQGYPHFRRFVLHTSLIQPPLRRREVPCDRHINGELASWC